MNKLALALGVTTIGFGAACGSSGGSTGTGAGGATTTTTTSTGTSTGTGDGGPCKKCGAMLSTADTNPADVCTGKSAMLYSAVTTCVCQPNVCGSAEAGADNCVAECTTPGTPVSMGCMACDAATGVTVCASQLAACNADM